MNQFAKFLIVPASLMGLATVATADEFTDSNTEEWYAEYMTSVENGRAAFTDPTLGGSQNGVVCAQCHPNASNTHPESYPKFQKQLGKVSVLGEMINWCLMNPLEAQPMALDDPIMIDLQAYITFERRGVEMDPGKH